MNDYQLQQIMHAVSVLEARVSRLEEEVTANRIDADDVIGLAKPLAVRSLTPDNNQCQD